MKRYNKQQVMKDAHRLYNNDFQRKGRTWSECLRAAWSWEKDAVQVREEKAARLDAMIAASWAAHNERKEAKTNENWYARFFKRIPNLLYLVFTILWIIISLFMNMF